MSARDEASDHTLESWNPSDFEVALLGSIERDTPPAGGVRRTLAALAVASATGAAAVQGVGAATGGGATSGFTLKTAWIWSSLACLFVVGGWVGGRAAITDPVAAESNPLPERALARQSSTAVDTSLAAPLPAIAEAPSVSVHALPSALVNAVSESLAPTPPKASAVSEASQAPGYATATEAEIALLEGIRDDLAAGRTAQAVDSLRNVERDHSVRIFEPEARTLLIEALAAQGDRTAARERADAFLRELPHDPHVSRVTKLRDRMTNP